MLEMLFEMSVQTQIILGVIICAFMLLCLFFALIKSRNKEKQLLGYWNVDIGMSREEMLSIMGTGYSLSLLKNNREKYEWRIDAKSYGSSYKGFSSRTYQGVKKVSIYVKDGCVEEIKTLNM